MFSIVTYFDSYDYHSVFTFIDYYFFNSSGIIYTVCKPISSFQTRLFSCFVLYEFK